MGMGSSGVVEMIIPAVTVEEDEVDDDDDDDGKLIVFDGCVEFDDMVSNAFRSSIIMG